jgi:acetyltransferase-like isoleucine patch superfamily enzyme
MTTIAPTAVLAPDAVLGRDVSIGHHVTIHPGVRLGEGCTVLDGAVLGRPPRRTRSMNRPVAEELPPLTIGAGSIVGANAVLYRGSGVGEGVLIGDLASIREGCAIGDDAVLGRGVLVMYDTVVGDRARVIDGAVLTGNMVVEEDVFIGPRVTTINDNDVYLKRFGLAAFSVEGPRVRRFALIGAGANLAAGVEVGAGAIVAPSAMVTRDVEPWTVVAGVPARVVRAVPAEQRRLILGRFGISESRQAS